MAKRYSIADARANLPSILDDVEQGGEVELTRRGKPVAVVISPRAYARLRSERQGFTDRYRAWVGRFPPDEIDLPASFFEALREPTTGRDVEL